MTSLSPAPGVHDQSETPPARAQQNQKGHTRTYQACIPCRNRKVRCDLGAVDNPHPPPCARCARESKECFFSATRRKRKTNDGYDESEVGDGDYESRNGRKKSLRLASVENEPPSVNSGFAVPPTQITPTNSYASLDGRPRTPGGSLGRTEPLRRPSGLQRLGDEATDQKLTSATTAILQTGEIFSGHDALNLLYEAAGRNGDIENHHSSSSNAVSQTAGKHGPTQSQNSFASPAAGTYRPSRGIPPVDTAYHQPASASVSQSQSNGASSSDAKLEVATKVWSKLRFVRAGWFTAKEGMAYLEHFYKFLSPLTPVVVPDYRDPGSHASLLRDESLLAVTLLTIASRHMQLEGPGGSSRAYEIHGMLWKYLQGMINRLIWGQEQFGGGFCGAGAQSGSEVDPFSRKGLRTLGTIESLLLITEWHPRALHFPPNDDGDELVPSDDTVFHTVNSPGMYKGVGGQRMDAWLEPCWRSDRICWMLLGNAMTLAYEIGVFDERSDDEYQQASPNVSAEQIHKYVRRKNHIRELLVVYSTQTSGRLGLTSMMPKMEGGRAILQAPALQLFAQSPGIRSPSITRLDLRSPNVGQSPMTPIQQSPQDVQDIVIHHWIEIAKLGELGNKLLFLNRNQTRDLIRSGKYAQLLDAFKPRMEAWRREFDSCTTMPHIMRHILTIEYEYSRVYINSLALQAVVVRCAANSPVDTDADIDPRNRGENGAIPFSTLSNWLYNDRKYVEEVIAASRTVLEIVVKHLYPVYLRHAPVRTFFRIVSVAIILLKTFALGATEQDVAISLGLLDQTAHVLSLSIVDDVHVGNRFAELLRTLTARIRSRFVRMAPAGGSSNNASRATSRSPLVAHAPIPGSNQNPYPNPSESSTPHMPPPQQPQNVAHMHTNHAAWPTYGGVQYFSGPSTPGFAGPLSGRATPMMAGFGPSGFPAMPSDPLQGISTEAFDPVSRGVNIMPPPNFDEIINGGYHGNTQGGMNGGPYNGNGEANSHGGNGGTGDGESSGPMPDWLALPLDNLLNYGADVTETTIGPTVGGIDLLDVLLSSMEGTA